MNIVKSWIASLIGPSLIGQLVRGVTKALSGYLIGLGLDGKLVGQFSTISEQIIMAIAMMLLSQGASALATKKALETIPETPILIKK